MFASIHFINTAYVLAVLNFCSGPKYLPPPEGPVPVSQKIRSISGGETDAGISAGAYADNGSPTTVMPSPVVITSL